MSHRRNNNLRNNKRKRTEGNQSVNWKQQAYFDDMNEISNDKYKKRKPIKGSATYQDDSYQQHNRYVSGKLKENEIHKNRIQNAEIKESITYYEKLLQDLKRGLVNESKDVFAKSVLQESRGKEVELSCRSTCSHCFELLLSECNDHQVMEPFMTAFAQKKEEVCTNANATHITELLIHHAVKNIKKFPPDLVLEDSEEAKVLLNSIQWLQDFGVFVLENLHPCLSNIYSSHVVCTLVRALGGDMSEVKGFMSKSSKNHKREFLSVGIPTNVTAGICDPVILNLIPKSFTNILKKLSKTIAASENIIDYVTDSSAATVIEALLFVLRKRVPKRCRKFISKLASEVFSQKDEDCIPLALLHKNCSYVVEEMFKHADEEMQHILWQHYFEPYVGVLVIHNVANYIIQRLFDVVASRTLFEIMCRSIWSLFDIIHQYEHYGIFVSMANACNRLMSEQGQFMQNIMHCLQCAEPEDRQSHFLRLLIGFQKYENCKREDKVPYEILICLQGSLVAQSIMKFHKPIKAIRSFLSMKPKELAFLFCHIQGCHVINAFFSSTTVGEKNKEKFLHLLKPAIVSVACDRSGSLTLSRLWMLLSLKLKEVIANELIQYQKMLLNDQHGSIIWKKFGLFHYIHDYNKWKKIQDSLQQKKKKEST